MKWQPIETAPRDGTDILVLVNVASVWIGHIAWYRGQQEWDQMHEGEQESWEGGFEDFQGWWSYTLGSVTQDKLDGYKTPTHWLPIPEMPNDPEH